MSITAIQSILFFSVAVLQSLTGAGGGTLYLSVLSLTDVHYTHIPVIALTSCIFSTTASTYVFFRQKQLSLNLILPFLTTAVPFSYIGGNLHISENIFSLILLSVMIVILGKIIFIHIKPQNKERNLHIAFKLCLGAAIGTLSGLVGIGGAVFLVPLFYYYNLASPKKTVAAAVLFILINSIFALLGHLTKLENMNFIVSYIPLFLAAVIGGRIGVFLTIKKISENKIKYLTSAIITAVCLKTIFDLL